MSETEIVGPGRRFATSHAVVIAIDAYKRGVPRLQNAVRDGLAVGRALGVDHGFAVQALFDERATADAVHRLLFEELPARVGPNDRVIVYFAGHGVSVSSSDGPNGYLLCQDAARDAPESFTAMRTVHDRLTALPCRHLLLVLDCCFAGTFRWVTRDVIVPRTVFRETFDRFVESPAWQVIASAASDQRAFDVFGDRGDAGQHSPFAAALLAGLAGAADLDGDALVTASELYIYARGQVERATDGGIAQTPALFPLARHERGEFVFQVPGRLLRLAAAPPLTAAQNPYRGLESFDETTRSVFFGRDHVVRDLARAVVRQTLTAVVGPSGCGKSSVVKAGLMPLFRARATASGRRRWSVVGPIRALDAVASLTDTMLGDGNTLIVIDQLEDVLTQSIDDAQRAAFLDMLARWCTHERVRLVVTVRSDYEPQLRGGAWSTAWDAGRFVVPPMSQDQLRQAIERPAEARELYFKPARLVDGLINEVVQMPGALPLLSFTLSELYRHYFERRGDDRAITSADVDAVGGVMRALTQRASSTLDALTRVDARYEEIAPRVILRLVSTLGSDPVRRRVARSELVFPDDGDTQRATALVEALVEARLLVTGSDSEGTPYVEPCHDGLIRGWDRLALWRRRAAAMLPVVRAAGEAAALWEVQQEAPAFLWHGDPRLAQLVALDREPASPLNRLERTFVEASEQRRRRRARGFRIALGSVIAVLATATVITYVARGVAERQRERAEAQRATALIELAPTLADPLHGALVLAEVEHASPAGWKASMVARSIDLQPIPLSVQSPSGNQIANLEIDASGRSAVATDLDGGAWLLDIDGRRAPTPLRGGTPIIGATFDHAGGPRLLVAAADGSATLWSTEQRRMLGALSTAAHGQILAGALAGDRAVIAHVDGTLDVYVFDAAGHVASSFVLALAPVDSTIVVAEDATRAAAVTFDPSTDRITVRIVAPTAAGAPVRELGAFPFEPKPEDPGLLPVFIASDGHTLAIHNSDRTLRSWDLATLEQRVEEQQDFLRPELADATARCFADASTGTVRVRGECGRSDLDKQADDDHGRTTGAALAFGIDGNRSYLAVGRADGSTNLWLLRTQRPRLLATYKRHASAVSAVALNPARALVATGSRDGEVRVWSMRDPYIVDAIAPLMFTNAHRVVTATYQGGDGAVIQTLGDAAVTKLERSDREQAFDAWFDRADRHVAVAYEDRTCSYELDPVRLERCCDVKLAPVFARRADSGAVLWLGLANGAVQSCDLATGRVEDRLPPVDDRHAVVIGFAVDAGGVLAARGNGSLWRIAAGATPSEITANGSTIAAAGEDGALVATVSSTGDVQIHRPDDGWSPHPLGRHVDRVDTLAITRDGRHVLSCTEGAACSLWDVARPGSHDTFWPRGRYIEMARDGGFVITAQGGEFLVWSPGEPGLPIELSPQAMAGEAFQARLSDDGKRLVTIWLDRGASGEGNPNERIMVWTMDWRDIVHRLRERTAACLAPKDRVALLDETPEEASRAHDRCAADTHPIRLPEPAPAAPTRTPTPQRAATIVALDRGFMTRVAIDDSDAAKVTPVWAAMLRAVAKQGGAVLVADRKQHTATVWTPTVPDVPGIVGTLIPPSDLDVWPWQAPQASLMLRCVGGNHDAVELLTMPLAAADLFDLDAARAGHPSMPAAKLAEIVAGGCAGASVLVGKPLAFESLSRVAWLDEIDQPTRPHDEMPMLELHAITAKLPRDSAGDPKRVGALIARIQSPTGADMSADAFARVFGHAPDLQAR